MENLLVSGMTELQSMQHAKAVILGVELALLMTLSRFGPDQKPCRPAVSFEMDLVVCCPARRWS